MLTLTLLLHTFVAAPDNLSTTTNPDAPPGVRLGFGRLVGEPFECQGSSPQPDGTWADNPGGKAIWHFLYTLDGHAVQDFWYPPAASGGAPGTNLRTYDAEQDTWMMVWATSTQARFDHFDASVNEEGDIVMTGERWARASFGEHHARITFYNIQEDGFDWEYEARGVAEGSDWSAISRISCRR